MPKRDSGLWLTVFGKSWLFRCQSAPGPPEPCYFITPHVIPTEPSGEWRNLAGVSALECFRAFGSRRAMSGFGLGLLVSQGFFDAKAPLDPLCNHPKLMEFRTCS